MAPDDQTAVAGDGHHNVRVMGVQQFGHTCLRLQRGPGGGQRVGFRGHRVAVGMHVRTLVHEGSMLWGCSLLHAETAVLPAARVKRGLGTCRARRSAAEACTQGKIRDRLPRGSGGVPQPQLDADTCLRVRMRQRTDLLPGTYAVTSAGARGS